MPAGIDCPRVFSFRIGPFPVTVFPWFFLSAVVLGADMGTTWKIFAWIFVVFVSVVFHELGHAVVGKLYGGHPEIRLEAFGGVTFPQLPERPGPVKQFVLSFAGPIAGLLLGAIYWGLVRVWPPGPGSPVAWMMSQFMTVSVIWAIFNLLPVLPLDGGQMMLSVLEFVRRKQSVTLASWLSFVFALAAAGGATLLFGVDPFMLLFFGLFAYQNFMRARASAGPRAPAQPASPAADAFEQADADQAATRTRDALLAHDYDEALRVAEKLETGGGMYRQAAGLRLRAGVELARGDNEAAALYAGQSYSVFQSPDAAVVAARANLRAHQEDRARNWLKRALEAGAPLAAVKQDPELGVLA